jgi:hypothetical protein
VAAAVKGSARPALCNRCLPSNAVGRQPIRERTCSGSGWVLVMFWHSGACSLVHRARCQVNQDARPMVSVWFVKSCFYLQRRLVLMNSFAMAAAGHDFWRSRGMARAFGAIFLSFMLLSSFAARSAAGPLEDAAAAFERRDFATAVSLLRALTSPACSVTPCSTVRCAFEQPPKSLDGRLLPPLELAKFCMMSRGPPGARSRRHNAAPCRCL